jgi:catecholate siderophore receptor
MAILKKYSSKIYFLMLALALAMRHATQSLAADSSTTLPEVVVTGQQDKKSYKTDKVSSSKYTEPLLDTPQTITIIPQAVIREQNVTTLREALRNTPGISLQAGEGGVPNGDNLSIRGFNARTDIFVDGVRDFGGYTRDPFNTQSIEVTKGPSSSFMGRGSTGGAINLVSKTPGDEAFYDGTIGLGATDEYQRYTLDVNQPLDDIGLDAVAMRFNAVYHDADLQDRDFVHDNRWGVAPSIVFGLGQPTNLAAYYFHLDQDNLPGYGIPWVPNTNIPLQAFADQPAPVDRSNFYGLLKRDFEHVDSDVITLVLRHEWDEMTSLKNLTRYGRTFRHSIVTAPRFDNNNSTDITREFKYREQEDTILSNQTDVTWKFPTGFIDHTLVTGVEFGLENDENLAKVGPNGPVTNLFNPDPLQDYTGIIFVPGAKDTSTAKTAGLYAFDTAKLNEQWQVQGGLRWDFFEVSFRPAASQILQRIDRSLSGRGAVAYKPRSNGSIYAAYGTSFNPSAEGLALSSSATAATNFRTDPEKSETYELGTKWDVLNERLSLSGALFRTEKTNARTEDPTNPNDILVLEGQQRVEGVELGAAGSITSQWHIFSGYAYMDSEILSSKNQAEVGNELANAPVNSFSLWTTYDLSPKIEAGFGATFVDERFSANNDARTAPDYYTLDAMAAYEVNQNVTLRLNAYNLTDEEYISSLSGGHFIPGSGRSVIVTTEFKF